MNTRQMIAAMRRGQDQALGTAQGKGTSKRKLLDDTDTNVGNAVIVNPYPDPASPVAVRLPLGNPDRILFLDALSPTGQTVTVGLTARTIINPVTPFSNATPITGIIEFGNGAQFTRIEVDIPVGPTRGISSPPPPDNVQFYEPEDGVVLVTVPAGTLRVYARNDSKLIVPDISGFVGDALLGPVDPPVSLATSVFVKAFTTYYSTRASWLSPTKTNYIGKTPAVGAITYGDSPSRAYLIPPLAKRFKVLRTSFLGAAMPIVTGTIYDSVGNALELFTIPAGTSPWIDLNGTAHRIGLSFTIGAFGVAALMFEIGA